MLARVAEVEPFAVGAGDEHGRKAKLRVAQLSEESPHIFEAKLPARHTWFGGQLSSQGVQSVDSSRVTHGRFFCCAYAGASSRETIKSRARLR